MKQVAVLGCGPAGLLTAWAALECGAAVSIFSEHDKMSLLGGAQFLHMPIPGITETEPETRIEYIYRGDEETYRRKVYGQASVPFVSFGRVKQDVQDAWSLRAAYERLWLSFSATRLNEVRLNADVLDQIRRDFHYVFSTVPLKAICRSPWLHQFHTQRIYISTASDVHDWLPDSTILWDGTWLRTWYRASHLFGVHGTEWGDSNKPPFPELITDRKPISTSCNCWDDTNVVLVGRRGQWRKGVLTHHAYKKAMKLLKP
ncbi:MAG TPA: hypothetical protein VH593_25235 [Ktedonobacteraceae bacterium]|jgi:hypothetical protein